MIFTLSNKLREALKYVTSLDCGTSSVLEKTGRSILAGLTRADPGMELGCQGTERTCPVEEKLMGWLSEAVYKVRR